MIFDRAGQIHSLSRAKRGKENALEVVNLDTLGPDRVDTNALLASPIGLFLGRYLLNIRKGLAQASDANLEASVLGGSNVAHDMRDVIALAGVAEFAGRFPKMLKRVEQLRVLETVQGVPDEVQDYLTEATKCFVNGQFIGCLLVCRSAIEFALRNRLEKAGRQQALSELDRDYRGGLDGLIELARRGLPWEFGKTLDAAAEVKKAANLAIHRCAPEVETCRSMFDLTRGVLRELFA